MLPAALWPPAHRCHKNAARVVIKICTLADGDAPAQMERETRRPGLGSELPTVAVTVADADANAAALL